MKSVAIIFIAVICSGCQYESDCYVNGESVYHYIGANKEMTPKARGEGWWKLPDSREPIQASCVTWMR